MSKPSATRIDVDVQKWPLKGTFTISRGSKTEAEVVMVTLTDSNGNSGRGECVPYARYGETCESVVEQIKTFSSQHRERIDFATIDSALAAGAARNALDCACWDLHARRSDQRVWELLGQPQPEPVVTAYTLSLDSVESMAAQARENNHRPLLKIKLGPDGATERIEAIRDNAENSKLIVDANEAWTLEQLDDAMTVMQRCNVVLIEQPLAASNDQQLEKYTAPIPLAADESCHTSADVEVLATRYDVVNIKLDKTGGLTEALKLKAKAEAAGLGVMIGCMMATSLSMAPATVLTPEAVVVDLDGPLWLAQDRQPGLVYKDHCVFAPPPQLWG